MEPSLLYSLKFRSKRTSVVVMESVEKQEARWTHLLLKNKKPTYHWWLLRCHPRQLGRLYVRWVATA